MSTQKCEWKYDDIDCFWATKCGNAWCFIVEGIKENGVIYCPYCGKLIEVVKEEWNLE